MEEAARKSWLGPVILFGGAYFAIGILFGELARWAGTGRGQFAWRLTAWVVSLAVFIAHVAYEHYRQQNKAPRAALHVALAAALGALLLAMAATLHMMRLGSTAPYWLYLLALVLWPLMTGVPAFVAAFITARVVALVSPRDA